MAKKKVEDKFCFTWGLGNLGDMGFVPLYAFMLRAYAQLGVSRQEMLCIIHLASYHYNSPGGESRPGLETVAEQMGYAHKQRVSELISKLEANGWIVVTRRPGFTSIYDARPFAQAAYDLWIQLEAQKQQAKGVTLDSNTPTDSVTPHSNTPTGSVTLESNGVLRPSVTEEYEKEEEGKIEEEISLSSSEKDETDPWLKVLEAIRTTLDKTSFDNIFRGSQLIDATNGTWRVEVRNAYALPWLRDRFGTSASFRSILSIHAPHVEGVTFIAREETP